jgi:hypothetical protein
VCVIIKKKKKKKKKKQTREKKKTYSLKFACEYSRGEYAAALKYVPALSDHIKQFDATAIQRMDYCWFAPSTIFASRFLIHYV